MHRGVKKSMESAGSQGSSESRRLGAKQPAVKPPLLRSYDYNQIRHAGQRSGNNEPAQLGQANVMFIVLPVVGKRTFSLTTQVITVLQYSQR